MVEGEAVAERLSAHQEMVKGVRRVAGCMIVKCVSGTKEMKRLQNWVDKCYRHI